MECHFCGKDLEGKEAYHITKLFLSDWDNGWWTEEEEVDSIDYCKMCNKRVVEAFRQIERGENE